MKSKESFMEKVKMVSLFLGIMAICASENFSVFRMHNGTYNHNPSVKVMYIAIKKNALLHLQGSLNSKNCIRNDNALLISGDVLSQSKLTTLSSEIPTNDNGIDTNVEVIDDINEL